MISFVAEVTRIESALQLIGLVLVFIFILVATYYTTRWVGKSALGQAKNRNIKVVETYKISPNKYIQIIQIGEKYIVIGISKDHMEYLTEIPKEQLEIVESQEIPMLDFKEILSKITSKKNK